MEERAAAKAEEAGGAMVRVALPYIYIYMYIYIYIQAIFRYPLLAVWRPAAWGFGFEVLASVDGFMGVYPSRTPSHRCGSKPTRGKPFGCVDCFRLQAGCFWVFAKPLSRLQTTN